MLNINETVEFIAIAGKHDLAAMLWGNTSSGKSSAVKELAKLANMRLVDFRLSQTDSGELLGLPQVSEDGKSFTYLAPDWWPKDDEPIILFLDEVNRARTDLINAVFQLALDKRVGTRELPKGSIVVSACNPPDGQYSVNELDDAFLTRFLNVQVQLSSDEFLEYLKEKGLGTSVVYDLVKKEPGVGEDMGTSIQIPKFPSTWRGLEKIAVAEADLEKATPNVREAFYLAAIGPDRVNEYIAMKEKCKMITGQELRKDPGTAIPTIKKLAKENKLDVINVCLSQFAELVSNPEDGFNKDDYEILVKLCKTVDRDFIATKVAEITRKLGTGKLNRYFKDGRLNTLIAEMINNHQNK